MEGKTSTAIVSITQLLQNFAAAASSNINHFNQQPQPSCI